MVYGIKCHAELDSLTLKASHLKVITHMAKESRVREGKRLLLLVAGDRVCPVILKDGVALPL